MSDLRSTLEVVLLTGVVAGCASPAPTGPTGDLAIDVAPLSLSGIEDADYTVTVTAGPNGTGDVVWTKALSSSRRGDGAYLPVSIDSEPFGDQVKVFEIEARDADGVALGASDELRRSGAGELCFDPPLVDDRRVVVAARARHRTRPPRAIPREVSGGGSREACREMYRLL